MFGGPRNLKDTILAAYTTSIDIQTKKKQMKLEIIKKRMRLFHRGVERTDGKEE